MVVDKVGPLARECCGRQASEGHTSEGKATQARFVGIS